LRREGEFVGRIGSAECCRLTRAASFSALCQSQTAISATTSFAFGGPDNQYIYFKGAISGTFWKFKAPYPGLIGPGGVRLPVQQQAIVRKRGLIAPTTDVGGVQAAGGIPGQRVPQWEIC